MWNVELFRLILRGENIEMFRKHANIFSNFEHDLGFRSFIKRICIYEDHIGYTLYWI